MDEATTRQTLIDPALRLAGWDIENPSQVITELAMKIDPGAVAETPQAEGAYRKIEFTDYALLSGGVPLAVVEAKRTSKDAEIGRNRDWSMPSISGATAAGISRSSSTRTVTRRISGIRKRTRRNRSTDSRRSTISTGSRSGGASSGHSPWR